MKKWMQCFAGEALRVGNVVIEMREHELARDDPLEQLAMCLPCPFAVRQRRRRRDHAAVADEARNSLERLKQQVRAALRKRVAQHGWAYDKILLAYAAPSPRSGYLTVPADRFSDGGAFARLLPHVPHRQGS